MKIIVITSFYPNTCDPTRAVFIKSLVSELDEKADIVVISPLPYVPFFLRKKEKYRCLHGLPYKEYYDKIKVYRPRYLVFPKTELLNGIMYAFGIFKALRKLSRQSNKQNVIVHTHSAYPDAVGSIIACRLLKLPVVTTVHGSDINVMPKNPFLRPQIRYALNRSNGIVAVSRKLIKKIEKLSVSNEIKHIPCAGYNPDSFSSVHSDDRVNNTYRIIFIGNLVKIKGVDLLINAVAKLKNSMNMQLDIIGKGPEMQKLRQMTKDRSLEHVVKFYGIVEHEKIALHLQKANLLCLPSYNEGTPNVVIEALASGLPVLATKVGALPDIVNDTNGILVNTGKIDELINGVLQAQSRKWDSRLIASTVSQFTWADLGRQNYEYLHQVCNHFYATH